MDEKTIEKIAKDMKVSPDKIITLIAWSHRHGEKADLTDLFPCISADRRKNNMIRE